MTGVGPGSAGEAVDWLRKHFRPGAAVGLEVAYQFKLSGPGGGSIWLRIGDSRLQAGEGEDPQPDVVLRIGAADFFGVLTGTANPDLLFLDDRIEIDGDLSLALKLRSLFHRDS